MKTLTAKLSVLIFLLISSSLWAQIPLNYNNQHKAYEVGTLADLVWLSDNPTDWAENYVQVADIDASATGVAGSAYWNGGAGFSPIGTNSQSFTGSFFNASSFIISNLYLNQPITNQSTVSIGLFGNISNAILNGIHLLSPNITGDYWVGALVGRSNNSLIKDCSAVNINVSGFYGVGGLIGSTDGTIILSSSAEGTLSGILGFGNYILPDGVIVYDSYFSHSFSVGGFVGFNGGVGLISGCVADVDVTGHMEVGGFVGSTVVEGIIESCASLGDVTGTYSVGGFVGTTSTWSNWDDATITHLIRNCYSTGVIQDNSLDNDFVYGNIGGFVGSSFAFDFQNCYTVSSISVSHSINVGAFVGTNGILNTYESIFYKTNGLDAGGIDNLQEWGGDSFNVITGLSTLQMGSEANFTGWNFTNIWNMVNGFPNLIHIYPATTTVNGVVYKIVDVIERNHSNITLRSKLIDVIKKVMK